MKPLNEATVEDLLRELARRADGSNVVHVVDFKEKSVKSYGVECADRVRGKVR